MKQPFFSTFSALSGVAAAMMAVIVVAIAGFVQPGYSHQTNLISELNAEGSPYQAATGYLGFIPVGIATLFFLWRLKDEFVLSRRVITALIFVATAGSDWLVTALAPCDAGCPVSGNISLSQKIHLFSGLLMTLLLPIGIFLLLDPLRQSGFSSMIIKFSVAVIAVNVLIFVLQVISIFPRAVGLLQRIDMGFFYFYLVLLSIETYRRSLLSRA